LIVQMSDDKKSPPFYERRLFQGTAAVVALVTAVLALEGQLGNLFHDLFPSKPPAASWSEVVLDTSAAMGKHFGGRRETKLESAAQAVKTTVGELDNAGVGLRRPPTSCEGSSEQLVDLADGRSDQVVSEARHQKARGNSSIIGAIRGALHEFDQDPMRNGGSKSRHLYVFTTAAPSCPLDDPAGEVHALLKKARHGEPVGMDVFALGPAQLESAEASSRSAQPRLELAAFGGSEEEVTALEALQSGLEEENARMDFHSVENPKELYAEAENVGKEAVKTAEQLEEQREREETEGPSG
jgi:hypothetical protein